MPLSLEPGTLFPIVLDSDAKKPVATRPTFWSVSLNMRDQLVLEQEMSDSLDVTGAEQLFAATCALLLKYIKRLENMGEFKLEETDLRQLLSHGEARELLRKVLSNQFVSIDEKKD